MKVSIDTDKTKGLYGKLLGTEAGKFASALDEMLYNGDVRVTLLGEHTKGESFCIPVKTYDKHAAELFNKSEESKDWHIESKLILAKLRDFLYQQALHELMEKKL